MKLDVIYQPRGQAGEYSPWATNHYENCGHKCVYCYVPMVRHVSREEFDGDARPRKDYLARLDRDLVKCRAEGFSEQVMLSFLTDPYNPKDAEIGLTRDVLIRLRDAGLGFCTLTKGGTKALRDIGLFRPSRDAFASTLTTMDWEMSEAWEPDAALPADRVSALSHFHGNGIFTWVSLEPVYDVESTLQVIEETYPVVDLYKVGRINYNKVTKLINWRDFTERVTKLLTELRKAHYIKADLQPYLPVGYSNPLRVRQHH